MAEPKIIQFPIGDVHHLQWRYKKVGVSSAEILTLNSAPKELVPAPGAGYVLIPVVAVVGYIFNTAPYDTNVALTIIHSGDIQELIQIEDLIDQLANRTMVCHPSTKVITSGINKALELTELIGDPATGSGTLTIYLWYINLEL